MANMEGFGESRYDEPGPSSVIAGARDRMDSARRQLADVDHKVRDFVMEHPIASLVGALAIGYAVGRVLRKL